MSGKGSLDASNEAIASYMNSISALEADVFQTEAELEDVRRELSRRRSMLATAQNMLGMALHHRKDLLAGSDFMVIKDGVEVKGDTGDRLFGRMRAE